jgi:SHS2 domain-containing protein
MFGRPDYREIEHTADVGVELQARDLRSALESAAAAMFDVICDVDSVERLLTIPLTVDAREGDLENLLVRWLTELLYVHQSRNMVLSGFEVLSVSRGTVEARVSGERLDPERHTIKLELKAPTYHELLLEEREGRWSVRVIFDT